MTVENSKILIEKIKIIYNEGWIKTLRKGDIIGMYSVIDASEFFIQAKAV